MLAQGRPTHHPRAPPAGRAPPECETIGPDRENQHGRAGSELRVKKPARRVLSHSQSGGGLVVLRHSRVVPSPTQSPNLLCQRHTQNGARVCAGTIAERRGTISHKQSTLQAKGDKSTWILHEYLKVLFPMQVEAISMFRFCYRCPSPIYKRTLCGASVRVGKVRGRLRISLQ